MPVSTSSAERPALPEFDAVVLAGARSARLGGADKALVEIGGMRLLDRVVSAVAGAATTIVVGPQRDVPGEVQWCREEPPDGGPVAAFAAGLALATADVVLLLGVDLPFIAAGMPALLAGAVAPSDVAALVDATGRTNYLASAWRTASARRRLAELPTVAGVSMRALFDGLMLTPVDDRDGWGTDCDTWAAINAAEQRGKS
jgi:molybdopterin-guanine dinucleotide biosynthesis protein A